MPLKDQLLNDLKAAMKDKDTVRKDTLQIIRAGVLQLEKDDKVTLDDDGVIDVIAKELKKRYDVLPDYEKSGRADSIDAINRQIGILKAYLPEPLSADELTKLIDKCVQDIITEKGAVTMKDMGALMKALTPKVKGRADNKLVSTMVKERLQ